MYRLLVVVLLALALAGCVRTYREATDLVARGFYNSNATRALSGDVDFFGRRFAVKRHEDGTSDHYFIYTSKNTSHYPYPPKYKRTFLVFRVTSDNVIDYHFYTVETP